MHRVRLKRENAPNYIFFCVFIFAAQMSFFHYWLLVGIFIPVTIIQKFSMYFQSFGRLQSLKPLGFGKYSILITFYCQSYAKLCWSLNKSIKCCFKMLCILCLCVTDSRSNRRIDITYLVIVLLKLFFKS